MRILILCAALLFLANPASAESKAGAFRLLYTVPGVLNHFGSVQIFGGPVSSLTTISCSNFSNTNQQIKVVIRKPDGTVDKSKNITVPKDNSITASTNSNPVFGGINLKDSDIQGGVAQIYATTNNVFCSAFIIGIGNSGAAAVALHMVRSNTLAGTVE